MADIQFYHLTSTPLERALPKLLEKSLQAGLKAVVKVASDTDALALDALLWTYDPASFLPHGTAQAGRAQVQPIYITAQEENPAQATVLFVTDGSQAATDAYGRILDIFDGKDDMAVAAARMRWKAYGAQSHTVSYIRQTATGGWEKVAA